MGERLSRDSDPRGDTEAVLKERVVARILQGYQELVEAGRRFDQTGEPVDFFKIEKPLIALDGETEGVGTSGLPREVLSEAIERARDFYDGVLSDSLLAKVIGIGEVQRQIVAAEPTESGGRLITTRAQFTNEIALYETIVLGSDMLREKYKTSLIWYPGGLPPELGQNVT